MDMESDLKDCCNMIDVPSPKLTPLPKPKGDHLRVWTCRASCALGCEGRGQQHHCCGRCGKRSSNPMPLPPSSRHFLLSSLHDEWYPPTWKKKRGHSVHTLCVYVCVYDHQCQMPRFYMRSVFFLLLCLPISVRIFWIMLQSRATRSSTPADEPEKGH